MINIFANEILREAFYESKTNLTQLCNLKISPHKNSDKKINESKNPTIKNNTYYGLII
jgi:hypothetical protein